MRILKKRFDGRTNAWTDAWTYALIELIHCTAKHRKLIKKYLENIPARKIERVSALFMRETSEKGYRYQN